MTISMHSASVPIFLRMLGNMTGWLDKAEAHAQAQKFDPSVYLTARLAPDMLPLPSRCRSRATPPSSASRGSPAARRRRSPTTRRRLPSCAHRIRQTVDYVQSVPADASTAARTTTSSCHVATASMTMKGEAYLKHFALPNFFFHVTTVYALLRHNGVELGKLDYLGAVAEPR